MANEIDEVKKVITITMKKNGGNIPCSQLAEIARSYSHCCDSRKVVDLFLEAKASVS
jgi:hypothetical protein